MTRQAILLCLLSTCLSTFAFSQGLATIQDNTKEAWPASYQFKEYIFAKPDDPGSCPGNANNTAIIEDVFLVPSHRHAIDHPFFFTIDHRLARLQIAVTGSGLSPDVKVSGSLHGSPLGVLCLNGPAELPATINLDIPNFEDSFSVTLPKRWVQDGLELIITSGPDNWTLSPAELKN